MTERRRGNRERKNEGKKAVKKEIRIARQTQKMKGRI